MLVGTVGTGMSVRMTGGISYVLVRVAVCMFMAMLMAVFVGPFHFSLILSDPHCCLLRC
jgi:hypothetical protein